MRRSLALAVGAATGIIGAILTRARTVDGGATSATSTRSSMASSADDQRDPSADRLLEVLSDLADMADLPMPKTASAAVDGKKVMTRRAIITDISAWLSWMRQSERNRGVPDTNDVLEYIEYGRSTGRKIATITRRVSSITTAYVMLGAISPARHATVTEALSTVRKAPDVNCGMRNLEALLAACGDGIRGERDSAAVRLAYAADLKSREIALVHLGDVELNDVETVLRLPPSAARRMQRETVPIDGQTLAAVARWRTSAGITEGHLFRKIEMDRKATGTTKTRGRGRRKDRDLIGDGLTTSGTTFLIGTVYDRARKDGDLAIPDGPGTEASRIRNQPLHSVLNA